MEGTLTEQTVVSITWGRDYGCGLHDRYEYVVYEGEAIVARKGLFRSSGAAKAAGRRAAETYHMTKFGHAA